MISAARGQLNSALWHLQGHTMSARALGPIGYVRLLYELERSRLLFQLRRHEYRLLSVAELLASRRGETVFIFGSGYSLNDISPREWQLFRDHETFGFSGFIHQRWVRVDYHLIRGWVETPIGSLTWRPAALDYAARFNANPLFRDTIVLLAGTYWSSFANGLIGDRLLRRGTSIYRYKTADRSTNALSHSIKSGLRHGVSTLCDAVNAAYLMGWRRLVLVGVDLYDSRYFWLPPDATLTVDESTGGLRSSEFTYRRKLFSDTHNTATRILGLMSDWSRELEREGVTLEVYNPRSLLSAVMPIYERPRTVD